METRDIFDNLSPLDHRYSTSDGTVFADLSALLSESGVVRSCVAVEVALLKTHLEEKGTLIPPIAAALDSAGAAVLPDAVYKEEKSTKHNIRALVNVLTRSVDPEFAPLVHLGATSADILDTASALRYRDAVILVILPLLRSLENCLCDIADREARTPQIGRTHGQHAVPITFGFAMAEYVSRLGKCIGEIEHRAADLRGKMAGPVGAYNGLALLVKDPEAFESRFLAHLGLKPSEHSTQLVEPEYLLRLLLEINVAFGIIANLADDLRHLQRSEIGEVFEHFDPTQVGSSTMPQKRNPWNSEHVKSLWKAFAPRVITFFMDQISEHQRDLTNSASSRFVAEYFAGFALAVERMRSVVAGLAPDKPGMAANLDRAGGKIPGGILAESAYILLADSGTPDAHEKIRRVTLEAEKKGLTFSEALKAAPEIYGKITGQLQKLGLGEDFFGDPAKYRGLAAEKAHSLAEKYKNPLD
jgi:adenylosuccinate lyase